MAMADYRLCDVCGKKAFYDANLNYDFDKVDPVEGPKLDYVSSMAVVCDDCGDKFRAVIEPKPQRQE
jgi:hypothetical protein